MQVCSDVCVCVFGGARINGPIIKAGDKKKVGEGNTVIMLLFDDPESTLISFNVASDAEIPAGY